MQVSLSSKKKKILLLSDDMRLPSGVGTISRLLVYGTAHKYDWFQVGGSMMVRPETGKILDVSHLVKSKLIEENRIKPSEDINVKILPLNNYGDPNLILSLIDSEKPDAILHFTDPRFWVWLYSIEYVIRRKIPLTYLNIWDDVPYPMYNRAFYESCDALFSISKQTMNINRYVLGPENCCTINDENMDGKTLLHYVPHGIDPNVFRKIDKNDPILNKKRLEIFNSKKFDFVIFFNSRNIQRKRISDIILAYRTFCDNLKKEEAEKCCLLLHTDPIDQNGTNLIAVKEALCPKYNVYFSNFRLPPKDMPYLYNLADIAVNISSNEGFGISVIESIMCELPIVVNVTGGIQDQIGQTDDDGNPVVFSNEFSSNSEGKFKNHGVWAYAIWPAARTVQGSIPTPYIFDSLARWEDCAEGFMYWYRMPKEIREKCGKEGRRWACNEGNLTLDFMCSEFIKGMDYVLSKWKPPKPFKIFTLKDCVGNTMYSDSPGFTIPKIDVNAIDSKIKKVIDKLKLSS